MPIDDGRLFMSVLQFLPVYTTVTVPVVRFCVSFADEFVWSLEMLLADVRQASAVIW